MGAIVMRRMGSPFEENMTFESNYKLTSFAMKLNKCHPYIKRDWKWVIEFIITHAIFASFFYLLIYNIIYNNVKNNDYGEACKNGTIGIVYYIITLKHFTMTLNQKIIREILDLMDEDYKIVKQLPEAERAIMHKYIQRGTEISVEWLLVTGGGSAIFPIKNVIILFYYWVIGDPKVILIFDLRFPNFIEHNVTPLQAYMLIFALVIYFGSYATCMYTAFTPLVPIFMMHCCSWLEICELRLQTLFEGDLQETEEKLKEIIRRLQHVYILVEKTLESFRIILEATLRGATLLLPITFYEIIEVGKNKEFPLEFISLIIGGILITSSPCYYSDLLQDRGESLRLAMYDSGWESVPNTKIRNTIRFVLLRAMKPTALRTLFKPVNLETLADVFQQAYAIFNMMNTMLG